MDDKNKMIDLHYRKHFNAYVVAFQRMGLQEADAKDVVQNAYVNVLTYQENIKTGEDLQRMFPTIAINELRKFRNDQREHPTILLDEGIEGPKLNMNKLVMSEVERMIEDFRPAEQKVLRMRFVDGLNTEDIGKNMGKRRNYVWRIEQDFLAHLRNVYGEGIFT